MKGNSRHLPKGIHIRIIMLNRDADVNEPIYTTAAPGPADAGLLMRAHALSGRSEKQRQVDALVPRLAYHAHFARTLRNTLSLDSASSIFKYSIFSEPDDSGLGYEMTLPFGAT